MTPLRVSQAITAAQAPDYDSGVQTFAANSVITLAHGLSERPRNVRLVARCTSANNGYVVGEELEVYGYITSAISYGFYVSATSTELKVRIGSSLYVPGTAGDYYTMNPASWRLVVRAWV